MTLPPSKRVIFISRAGEDRVIAQRIDRILQDAGYETYLQDTDFGNASFMQGMVTGFEHVEAEGCLIAVLSENYLRKPHCLKEAYYPLIDDPMNSREKLVVLRIDRCGPRDFLKDISYFDIGPLLGDQPTLIKEILARVERAFSKSNSKIDSEQIERPDPSLERILLFLENEDEGQPERAFWIVLGAFYCVGALLIAFDYGLDAWNAHFETSYYAIFGSSSVFLILIFLTVLMFGGMFWQMRTMAKTIEDAHLSSSQLRALRKESSVRNWRSQSLMLAVVSMATRNITMRRSY